MDEVARTAGVGKGTVYRRFVDRAALWAFHLAEGHLREDARRAYLNYVRRTLGTAA